MNENKNCNQYTKDWWSENKRVIKAGITCGLLGLTYGLIRGVTMTNRLWLTHGWVAHIVKHGPSSDVVVVDF